MDEFEQAILVAFSPEAPVAPEVRQQAARYCDAFRERPDSWRLCWEQFSQRDRLEVRFWCLQALCRSLPAIPAEHRLELCGWVLAWLRDVAPSKQDDIIIRNKVALVYVGLLKAEYPERWPSAWRDLVGLLEKGPNLVDMLLRVLATFDQEVVSEEVPRSTEDRQRARLIKHAMREGDVMHLAECWYTILTNFRQTAPQLVTDCLKAVGIYIVWVEIELVANDRFLDAICGLIQEGGPPAIEACECLAAVLGKKMPMGKKIQMLGHLRILQRLEGCVRRDSPDILLIEKQAELFNTVSEETLGAYEDLRVQQDAGSAALAQAAWELIEALTPSIFWFFSHQEYQIADSVEPFLTLFYTKVKSFLAAGRGTGSGGNQPMDQGPCHMVSLEQMRPILMQTLQLIIQRIAYPDWFQHCDPSCEDDERHIAFLEFRRSLTKIYKRIFLLDEQMGIEFAQASIAQLTHRLSSIRPMEVEAVLHLFREAGETVKDIAQHLKAKGPLAGCFLQLIECEALLRADHWAVQLALLEVYVRYARVFAVHTEFFPTHGQRVVEAFVGAQGIRASDPRVVTRACFMFSRFANISRAQMLRLTMQIFDSLKDLMVVQYVPSALLPVQPDGSLPKVVVKGTLNAEDRSSLYEAIASLVASMPQEQLRPSLQALLQGPAHNLAEICGSAPARLAADPTGYALWSACSVDAVATVSKAFSTKQVCCAPDWEEVLGVVARMLDMFPAQLAHKAGLWRAVLFLCRRMVEVLGDLFLGPLDMLLPLLFRGADQAVDLLDITTFSHQVVCQYQLKAQTLMQKWLSTVFVKPHDTWKQMPEESEEMKREKFELGCAILQFLKECGQRCPMVLLEPMLVQGCSTEQGVRLVSFLLLGIQDPSELRALLLATSTWSALLEAAVGLPGTHESLASLPLDQLSLKLLWSVARMDYSDAQTQKILAEAAVVLRNLMSTRLLPQGVQQQAADALSQALVGALPGLRSDSAPRRLCEALSQDCSLKDIRAALQDCVSEWRRDTGP